MNAIGAYALRCACVVALYAVSMAFLGVRLGRQEMVRSAERATYGVFGLVSIAMLAMLYALLSHDFHLQYVAHVSHRAMPTFYVVAALWGGQEGSMLLWLWILALYSALAVAHRRHFTGGAVGLCGIRLGRLLGLGSGRERVPDVLVDRHRLAAFGDDAGKARHAESL